MTNPGKIRALIEDARATELESGLLFHAVIELARQNGETINTLQAGKVIDFVTAYIEQVPALMAAVEIAAADTGREADVRSMLDAIEAFFLATDDVIPDHFGLAGLLDDAYLAHMLLAAAVREPDSDAGRVFLTGEAARANRFVRRLIGEPFGSILDERVASTLDELGDLTRAGEVLTEIAWADFATIIASPDLDTRVAEITGVRV